MALTAGAERQRQYRARLNADPERREKHLQNERQRWRNYVATGKREQQLKRRAAYKRSMEREALRKLTTPPQSQDPAPGQPPHPGFSRNQDPALRTMEDIKTEPVDFVKEFQEYLTQQTQHVNMISGSVCAEKGPDESFQAGAPKSKQNGLDPSVDVSGSLEDGGELQMDGLERTPDGKYKCSYCNYANKGMARLIEHIRIHTGEKPHRCQLCPFASAYERHLEAHMRSHTGEKPYKCDLCTFRCSDRSNLSHHRRRRHKLVPVRAVRSAFANKRVLGVLQKRSYSLGFGKRLVFSNFSPAPLAVPKADYLNDFSRVLNHHMGGDESAAKVRDGGNRGANGFGSGNPLEQLSTLAADLPRPANETQSLDRPPDGAPAPCNDEKPILIQQVSGAPVAVSTKEVQTLQSLKYHCSEQSSYGMEESNSYDDTPHDLSAGAGVSQPSASTPALSAQDFQGVPLMHICQHCDVRFSDNVLYTIHMGCHGCENPFQCNICGIMCRDKYDFACHFARGQHKK